MLRSSDNSATRNPQPETSRMVEVQAPATLNEGYIFWAALGDGSFPVKVPSGGVKSGQTLRVPLLEEEFVRHKGQWKDGLCSCFRLGLFHPHLWNAWLCPQVLLGQMLTRMKMTWLANSAGPKSTFQKTLRKIMFFLISFSLYDAFVTPPLIEFTVDENGDLSFHQNEYPFWRQVFYVLISLPMTIFGLIVVVKLRSAIRAKYGIPTGRLGRMEDFCCVCCCNFCVISQMARQTADYEDESASCCSPNGMKRECKSFSELDSGAIHV